MAALVRDETATRVVRRGADPAPGPSYWPWREAGFELSAAAPSGA